ncbi:MAG: WXG100 family type VII secretion target [Oscillospiraceae bacterium]|jgi:WXG100 family type VII secretion target|nr:WXG100 family type VII secretion target [Oscillospiraceae bacterium]
MAQFGVNSAQLSAIAGRIASILGTYDSVVNNVRTHAADINAKWRGEAQAAFESQMSTADGYLRQIRAVVEQYGEFLTKAAGKYDDADSTAAGIVAQMHG